VLVSVRIGDRQRGIELCPTHLDLPVLAAFRRGRLSTERFDEPAWFSEN
jgi:hypothetical protein